MPQKYQGDHIMTESAVPTGPSRVFRPFVDVFEKGTLSMLSQPISRFAAGYFASALVPQLSPFIAGALVPINYFADGVASIVHEELDSPAGSLDTYGIRGVTKVALGALQFLICSQVFSMSFATFATYYVISEITNALVSGTIGAGRTFIDPFFEDTNPSA